MKRRRRIHSPNRYQVIALSSLAEAPRLAAVLGVKDRAVTDDPAVLRVEESRLAKREWNCRHAWIVRPRAVGLKAQHRAGQSGGDTLVAAKQVDREQRIAGKNLRSRDQCIGRRSGLFSLMGKIPGLAAVVGLNYPSLESASCAMFRVAERHAEKRRQQKIRKARIVIRSGQTLPLRHQRLLLLTPGLARVFGRPDSSELADHPSVINVEEARAVEHRFV